MRRYSRRTPLAVVVALVLLGIGLLVAIEAVRWLTDQPTDRIVEVGRAWITSTRWENPVVIGSAGILALVGLCLVAAAVLPGKPTVLPLAEGASLPVSGATRQAVTRLAKRGALDVDGVRTAQVAVRRNTVRVNAALRLRDETGFRERIRARVEQRIDETGLTPAPHVVVRVRPAKGGT